MAATALTMGSRGEAVRRLQEALNRKLPGCALRVDGDFGNNTRVAVRRYQDEAWLVVDGIAGQCTQNALFDAESYAPIRHQRPFIPQPTDNTCWAASTAMLKRSTVPAVIAATPADLIAGGGLSNSSNRADWEPATQRFAQAHGLRYFAPQSWTPQGFVNL
ncbi:MAG TPA: peptidoglycan-binding protein, partial [Thermomonas sp.]|nr:peptidoglycan-binding protein [Thermomonas sp.]